MRYVLVSVVLSVALGVAAPSADTIRVRLELSSPGALPAGSERYVALIQERFSLAAPSWEAVSTDDVAAWWVEVPEGRYRLLCSGQGYLPTITETFAIGPTSALVRRCALSPGTLLEGRLLARETNRPVPGARIGPLERFLPETAREGVWSPAGEDHLRRVLVADADERGFFRLPWPAGGSQALWATAPGCAALYRKEVAITGREQDLGDLLLGPGGALDVEVRFSSGFDTVPWWGVLSPLSELDFDYPVEMFSQPLRDDGQMTWTGLPEGFYLVRLQRAPGPGADPGVQMGIAEVGPGGWALVTGELVEAKITGSLRGIQPHELAGWRLSINDHPVQVRRNRRGEVTFSASLVTTPPFVVSLDSPDGCQRLLAIRLKLPDLGSEWDLDVPGGRIVVGVEDQAGRPVRGPEFLLVPQGHLRVLCRLLPGEKDSWRREFSSVPPGDYLVLARKAGTGVSEPTPVVVTGGEVQEKVVRLEPGWEVRGAVFDGNGLPWRGATVAAGWPQLEGALVLGGVDRDGSIVLRDLPALPGALVVASPSRDLAGSFTVFPFDGEDTDVGVIRGLPAGGWLAQAGSFTDVQREPMDGLSLPRPEVNGVRMSSVLAFMAGVGGWWPTRPGAPFFMRRLPPGRIRVCWPQESGERCSRMLHVAAPGQAGAGLDVSGH